MISPLSAISRVGIVIFIAASFVLPCCSQTEGSSSESYPVNKPALTLQKEVPEVNLLLTVTDRHSHFVRNLLPTDFTIKDNGEAPKRVTHFESQTNLPLRLALVIDTSDSVAYCMESEKYAAKAFLRGILHSASDLALVINFSSRVNLVQSATADQRLLSHAIGRLRHGGDTAIYDAVGTANTELAKLDASEPSRRSIILITDGDDTSSKLTLKEAAQITQENGTVVYVLDTGVRYVGSAEGEANMRQLADMTGGRFFKTADGGRLDDAFDAIKSELRSQYAISYVPENSNCDGLFHQIVVLVPKKLIVRHRQGYFAR